MFGKIAVLGAGAIGSIIGGYLTRAGHQVTLIDPWAAHVEAMRSDGIRITAEDEEFTVPVEALHLGEVSTVSEPFDTVFLCVKSYDTVWAVHLILPYLKPTGVIVSAQNAINDELIAPIVGFTRDIGCIITLGAGMYEPAHAVRTTIVTRQAFKVGELNGMPTQRVQRLADVMTAIGPTKVTTNLWGERWSKLGTNAMANSVCSLTGLSSAEMRLTPGVVDISIKIASEVVKVGKAMGVEVEPINGIPAESYAGADDAQVMEDLKTQLAAGAGELGEGRPSMLQDVMKGRRTEIDYLNGYVATRGKAADVPTPVNEALTGLIKRMEKGELRPDISNMKHLESFL